MHDSGALRREIAKSRLESYVIATRWLAMTAWLFEN
jgi:hypothetical protein